MRYSVKELSKLAGISVRTLHHYDHLGVLTPSYRSEKGYRYYEREKLLRLQQIMFYKELDFPLQEIKRILDSPTFDLIHALESHREELTKKSNRLIALLTTIDHTILELKNERKMMTDQEIYDGFDPATVKNIREEVKERWGEDKLHQAEQNIRRMSKSELKKVKAEGEQLIQLLGGLIDRDPGAPEVQNLIEKYHRHLNVFDEVSIERYAGLSNLYVEDERFRAYYEKYASGLPKFIQKAIMIYSNNQKK